MGEQRFRMGSLDHVHLRVPDRAELIDTDGIEPQRYWPRDLLDGHRGG